MTRGRARKSSGGRKPAIAKILAATDFSQPAARALRRAVLLAREHQARLVVFNTLDVPAQAAESMSPDPEELLAYFRRELRREVREAGAGRSVRAEVIAAFGRPFVEIVRQARASAADLIVLGVQRVKDPQRGMGGTAEKVIRKGDRPVLVVRRRPARPYRRVVVGVDFSPHSRRALETALDLVSGAKAEFHLVHAYSEPVPLALAPYSESVAFTLAPVGAEALFMPPTPLERREARRAAVASMDAFIRHLDFGGRTSKVHLSEGLAAPRVLGAAKRLHAELLVLGTHGRGAIPHALLGSVAEEVLRMAACDVLVVRMGRPRFRLP
jgi:universal stress protein E